MIIREPNALDWSQLQEIHEKFYKDEFSFDEFHSHFLTNYVVVDDHDRVITGGGLRTILESVLVTDKEVSPFMRRKALVKILQGSLFASASLGYDGFHCFVQDEIWKQHLLEHGFKKTKGQSLVIGIG